MRRFPWQIFVLGFAAFGLRCSPSDACVPGEVLGCACPGGERSIQACGADAAHYDACQCGSSSSASGGAISTTASASGTGGAGGVGGMSAGGGGQGGSGASSSTGGGVATASSAGGGGAMSGTGGFGGFGGSTAASSGTGGVGGIGGASSSSVGGASNVGGMSASVAASSASTTGSGGGVGMLWFEQFGDASNYQQANAIAVDSMNDVFVAGDLTGSATFGSTTLTSSGFRDVFVAKLDPTGASVWAKRFGDTSDDSGTALAIDLAGNVIVGGRVSGSVDFGGGAIAGSATTLDACVAKYDNAGNYLWAKRFGDGMHAFATRAIATTSTGQVVVAGDLGGTVAFLDCPAVTPPNFAIGAFVAELSADGTHCLWSKALGGYTTSANALAVDASNNVFVAGSFFDSADLGGGVVPPNGSGTMFLDKLSSAGVFLFEKYFTPGNGAGATGNGVVADATGNAYVTGGFTTAVGLMPPVSISFGADKLMGTQASNGYLVEFSSAGSVSQDRAFVSPNGATGLSLARDASNDIVMSGMAGAGALFGNPTPLATNGLFAAKYSGGAVSVKGANGGSTSNVAVNSLGHVLVAGGFNATLDFGTGITLTSLGGTDIFIGDLGP